MRGELRVAFLFLIVGLGRVVALDFGTDAGAHRDRLDRVGEVVVVAVEVAPRGTLECCVVALVAVVLVVLRALVDPRRHRARPVIDQAGELGDAQRGEEREGQEVEGDEARVPRRVVHRPEAEREREH